MVMEEESHGTPDSVALQETNKRTRSLKRKVFERWQNQTKSDTEHSGFVEYFNNSPICEGEFSPRRPHLFPGGVSKFQMNHSERAKKKLPLMSESKKTTNGGYGSMPPPNSVAPINVEAANGTPADDMKSPGGPQAMLVVPDLLSPLPMPGKRNAQLMKAPPQPKIGRGRGTAVRGRGRVAQTAAARKRKKEEEEEDEFAASLEADCMESTTTSSGDQIEEVAELIEEVSSSDSESKKGKKPAARKAGGRVTKAGALMGPAAVDPPNQARGRKKPVNVYTSSSSSSSDSDSSSSSSDSEDGGGKKVGLAALPLPQEPAPMNVQDSDFSSDDDEPSIKRRRKVDEAPPAAPAGEDVKRKAEMLEKQIADAQKEMEEEVKRQEEKQRKAEEKRLEAERKAAEKKAKEEARRAKLEEKKKLKEEEKKKKEEEKKRKKEEAEKKKKEEAEKKKAKEEEEKRRKEEEENARKLEAAMAKEEEEKQEEKKKKQKKEDKGKASDDDGGNSKSSAKENGGVKKGTKRPSPDDSVDAEDVKMEEANNVDSQKLGNVEADNDDQEVAEAAAASAHNSPDNGLNTSQRSRTKLESGRLSSLSREEAFKSRGEQDVLSPGALSTPGMKSENSIPTPVDDVEAGEITTSDIKTENDAELEKERARRRERERLEIEARRREQERQDRSRHRGRSSESDRRRPEERERKSEYSRERDDIDRKAKKDGRRRDEKSRECSKDRDSDRERKSDRDRGRGSPTRKRVKADKVASPNSPKEDGETKKWSKKTSQAWYAQAKNAKHALDQKCKDLAGDAAFSDYLEISVDTVTVALNFMMAANAKRVEGESEKSRILFQSTASFVSKTLLQRISSQYGAQLGKWKTPFECLLHKLAAYSYYQCFDLSKSKFLHIKSGSTLGSFEVEGLQNMLKAITAWQKSVDMQGGLRCLKSLPTVDLASVQAVALLEWTRDGVRHIQREAPTT